MNKGDLISKIAEEANLTKVQASEALNATLSAISESLQNGDKTSLVGFGTFTTAVRKARMGINPKTKAAISIPEKTVVKFKPGKDLVNSVN
ncbi:MAG TPA: HU family DNA-binding protein [Saprospiraceae bacterium]|nr:HU family DNA-binding protein [Saprospiraceae bacterium]